MARTMRMFFFGVGLKTPLVRISAEPTTRTPIVSIMKMVKELMTVVDPLLDLKVLH